MTTLIGVNVQRTDATPQFTVGQIFQAANGKKYKYLLFNNGAGNVAPIVGDFAYYYGVSGAAVAANSNTVTMDLTDAINGAGVFQTIVPDGEYCWLQITGEVTLTTDIKAGANGQALTRVGATTDGTLDVSSATSDAICAIAYHADTGIVKLCCPE